MTVIGLTYCQTFLMLRCVICKCSYVFRLFIVSTDRWVFCWLSRWFAQCCGPEYDDDNWGTTTVYSGHRPLQEQTSDGPRQQKVSITKILSANNLSCSKVCHITRRPPIRRGEGYRYTHQSGGNGRRVCRSTIDQSYTVILQRHHHIDADDCCWFDRWS